MFKKFPIYIQHDSTDCGPSCLRMIARFYGKNYSLQFLRENCFITRNGVSLLGISEAAEKIGFHSIGVSISYRQLLNEILKPCIVHWNQNHFIIVYKIKKDKIYVADPAYGLITYTKKEFLKGWLGNINENSDSGICLILEPTPKFYDHENEQQNKTGLTFLFSYLKGYKAYFTQLILSVLFGSLIQLILPFITQSIIDTGIGAQDINFIYLVLIAQMMLFISRTSVEFIRSRILIHISARINIRILSDFLSKIMRLPMNFFDSKMTGDLLQRMQDHERVEHLLTSQTLYVLFSLFNFVIFSIVLSIYNLKIFILFIIGTILYGIWIILFIKKRKELDYKKFSQLAYSQSHTLELIEGIQQIKLNNCEKQKRWKWEKIQAALFRINLKNLSITQYQQSGSVFINETKNILITIMSATAVLHGEMTLGMMLAVQYILGQLNGPVEQMIYFIQVIQNAQISLERISEVHNKPDEENPDHVKITLLPSDKTIYVNNLTFQYQGPLSDKVLNGMDLQISQNKVTAIVGTSGSGKTTFLKLLLGFYKPTDGEIKIGDNMLQNYDSNWWRTHCGAVMQDGFIFSDTIAANIALSDEKIDKEKLLYAAKMANIHEFIEGLPLGYNTKIGKEGNGLSQGQKQRILIASAIYKNPDYLFFDEATNALDANNEKTIIKNLKHFFKGKTVVIVAHRLSTVKDADQIVVLDHGKIVESGNHFSLSDKRGIYFNLVRNQLELGN